MYCLLYLQVCVVGLRQEAGLRGVGGQLVHGQLSTSDGVECDQQPSPEHHGLRRVREVCRAALQTQQNLTGGRWR